MPRLMFNCIEERVSFFFVCSRPYCGRLAAFFNFKEAVLTLARFDYVL